MADRNVRPTKDEVIHSACRAWSAAGGTHKIGIQKNFSRIFWGFREIARRRCAPGAPPVEHRL
jgi:hypothetical protein